MLRLLTFGGLSLVNDGIPVTGAASQRSRLALLAVLASCGSAGISRDKLLALLWPESDEERARHALKQGVYALRRDLGNDSAIVGTATLSLDPTVVPSDVREFDDAIVRGDDAAAAALYTGPFLDGVFIKSAAEFDQWAASERSRLERVHLDAIGRLARAAETSGDQAAAAHWWRRAAAAEPLSGRVALSLMRVLADSGDVSAAIQHARVHEAIVKGELDSPADDAVLAFAEELRRGEYVPASRPVKIEPARVTAGSPSSDGPDVPAQSAVNAIRVDAPSAMPATHPDVAERIDATGSPAVRPRPRWRRPLIAVALVILGVVVGRLLLPSLRNGSSASAGSVAANASRRIVVATFDNRTGDSHLDPLGELAADWIARTMLEAGFEVVDARTSATINRMLGAFGPAGTAHDRAAALAKRTGAATVVTGSYYRLHDSLQFEADIMDPVRGVILHAVGPVKGRPDDAPALIGALSNRVTASLSASTDSTAGASTARLGEPPSVEAFEHTSRAWEMFFARPADTAAVFAELAVSSAIDSAYAAPKLMRAYVLDVKEQWASLATTVAELEPRRGRMGRSEREALALFEADLRGDLLGRLRASRELSRLSPGSADMALLVAVSSTYLGRFADARDALAAVSPDQGISLVSPMYWAWRGLDEHLLGRHADELASAQQEWRRFPTSATSAMSVARSYAAQGNVTGLDSLLSRAGMSARAPRPEARWLGMLAARELRAHGRASASVALFNRIASLPTVAQPSRDDLLMHALALYESGRFAEARNAYDAIPGGAADIEVVGRLGAIAARTGDSATVASTDRRLSQWPAKFTFGLPSYWRARLLALSGRGTEAVTMIHGAVLAGYRPFDLGAITLHDDGDFAALWNDPGFKELVRARTGPAIIP
ncbi:MAG: FlgO family outer membrane protein [Gemmatimonadota bacterium]|nr:FlgO family outer membrane protein [Gemmatimonadota bacterium]